MIVISRRLCLASLIALAAICLLAGQAGALEAKPNIVLIVADDFGYGDLSLHGCKDILTPHIDSIGSSGVRCTQGYVSAPQCSPTRAGLLTGRYQQRFGHEHNAAKADSALELSEKTVAEQLKTAGYATGLVGKWHLGSTQDFDPLSRGFDEFFGFLGGANPYLPQGPQGIVPRIVRNREPVAEKEFLTEAFAREAVQFIDKHQREPFFLYLAFNAPHGPLQAPPSYLDRFSTLEDEKRRTYAAMVSAMDDAVGRVLGKLRTSGAEQNTLIFFISDNGGPTDVNASRNAPFRGVKGELSEGGIRTPFFVQWKAKLPAGIYDQPVISLDIHPTVLNAAGLLANSDAKLDGVNLLPHLLGEASTPPHETLYWRFNFPPARSERHKWAIRQGQWKLFTDYAADRASASQAPGDATVKLIDLSSDITESNDLSKLHPERVKAMSEAWKKWSSELPDVGAGDVGKGQPKAERNKPAKRKNNSDRAALP
jgi:arylsulfatase A-like enzyme